MTTVGEILRVICDDKSLCIFNTIGLAANHDSDILIKNIRLSRKQFYKRVSKMIHIGLVTRSGGRYNLTSLGKIVYHVQVVIGNALKDHWKLKALKYLNNLKYLLWTYDEHEVSCRNRVANQNKKYF